LRQQVFGPDPEFRLALIRQYKLSRFSNAISHSRATGSGNALQHPVSVGTPHYVCVGLPRLIEVIGIAAFAAEEGRSGSEPEFR